MNQQSQPTAGITSEESTASFGFKSNPNPHESGGPTLHGLTHSAVELVIGVIPNHEHHNLRYVDIVGERGSLSGYVDADMFEAVCRALGVQS